MQLVLADTSAVVTGFVRDITIDKGCIYQSLMAYMQGGGDLNDEGRLGRAKKELVGEIMKTEDDVGGPISIKVRSRGVSGTAPFDVSVTPSTPDKNIFKTMAQKFQGKVKISLCMYRNTNTVFASTNGMEIHPVTFTCVGYVEGNHELSNVVWISPQKIHVKLVADIGVAVTFGIRPSPAQKVLEKGTCSDIIISTGNGAEIKAHKAFLCLSSPVLEAMLGSGMEESQTGRVDMSDLSEEGVRAFLRYVYYEDMQGPEKKIQIAYELFYASHKYDVPSLEAEMRMLLMNAKNEDISVELAFKIFMFTRTIESAVELKRKTIQIMKCKSNVDKLCANHRSGESSLEAEIDAFLVEANEDAFDVAVAFKMYLFARNIEPAVELKNKALRVLKAKWNELESLKEYNDLFEKPSNSKIARELCRDLAMAAST